MYFQVCLTQAARKLARKHVLVKHSSSIESLGATQVLCIDKTGTLTQNRLTVIQQWYNGKMRNVDTFKGLPHHADMYPIHRAAVLCNNAEFDPGQGTVHTWLTCTFEMEPESKMCLVYKAKLKRFVITPRVALMLIAIFRGLPWGG